MIFEQDQSASPSSGELDHRGKALKLMREIKKICTKSKERLYLANSDALVQLIRELHLIELYPNLGNLSVDFATEENIMNKLELLS
jgi:hypothetical protein